MNPYYKEYAQFLAEVFPGVKVQKVSVDAGIPCPNRDGTIGRGGCIYCNNRAFTPSNLTPGSPVADIAGQLDAGIRFFARKYPQMRYLAYFQANTSTNAPLHRLQPMLEAACSHAGVAGLVIATRPDCLPEDTLGYLAEINAERMPVIVEFGAETSHDDTLRAINRGHTWATLVNAVTRAHGCGLRTGVHLINGLPGESEDDMLATVDRLNALPVDTVKFHQLQVVRGTALAAQIESGQLADPTYTLEAYIALCVKLVHRLRRNIAIDRFVSSSPADLLIAPRWNVKNYQFTAMLHRALAEAHETGNGGATR